MTANRMLNMESNNPSPLPFLVHCLIDIIIGWAMSISFAFELDLSAVFLLLLSVLTRVTVQHTIVWHICFRNKYTLTWLHLSAMTIYNLSAWIWSNFLNSPTSQILLYPQPCIIPVSVIVAGLISVRFSPYRRSFTKTSDITDSN